MTLGVLSTSLVSATSLGFTPGPCPQYGIHPAARGVRNGVQPCADSAWRAASYVNQLLAHRKQVVFRHSIDQAEAYDTTTSATTWRFRFFSGVNGTKARVHMVFAPTAASIATAPDPRCYWTVTASGGGSSTKGTLRHNKRVTSSFNLSQLVQLEQSWTLTASTHYTAELTVIDRIRPVACTVYLEPSPLMSFSSTSVPSWGYSAGSSIYGGNVTSLFSVAETLWKERGTNHGAWSQRSTSGTAVTYSAGGNHNLWDTSVTAWNANAPGFYTIPYMHGRYHSSSVPIVFWAYASAATANGALYLVRDGGTIGSLTVTNGAAAWYTTTGNLRGDQTDEKYDVLASPGFGGTVTVHACGFYEHSS
jgi:hypothetical protein